MALERTYNVPLRKAWLKSPKYKRAKKAISALKIFLAKHMKSDNVKIGRIANMEVWKDGIKNPPHHIQVKATKDDENVVRAELVGFDFEMPIKKEAKKPKSKLQEAAEKLAGGAVKKQSKEEKTKEIEEKVKKLREEKQAKAKEVEKQELKDIKKEPAKKDDSAKSTVTTKEDAIAEKKDKKSSSGKEKAKDKQ